MVTLNARGSGRYFGAAFLGIWLCGWVAGEGFALWLLGNAAVALMSGGSGSGTIRISQGGALAMGGFVLLWLVIWTLGGMAAMTEFFRLLCGEDRMSSEGGGLTLEQSRGPFRKRREFPRDTIRRFLVTARGALVVETTKGQVDLSRLGTLEERQAAAKRLESELGITRQDPATAPVQLPKGWEEIITPEGERAVAPAAAPRRVKARFCGVIALGTIAGLLAVIQHLTPRSPLIALAIQLGLAAAFFGTAAVWLGLGRIEYRPGNGVVTKRRRFGSGVKDVFQARGFEVLFAADRSDHGEWYALDAVSDPPATSVTALSPLPGAKRKRVMTVSSDPMAARQLGIYLARAGNVPFLDHTAPEVHAAEVARMKEQLGKAGALGRLAVRLVEISEKRKQA